MPCDSATDLDHLEIFSSILSDVKSKCFELSHINYNNNNNIYSYSKYRNKCIINIMLS